MILGGDKGVMKNIFLISLVFFILIISFGLVSAVPVYTNSLNLENKQIGSGVCGAESWNVINDGIQATLDYNIVGTEFQYNLTSSQLPEDYVLIYYADQDPRFNLWGGNPAVLLGTLTLGGTFLSGSINIGSLPFAGDWNSNPLPNNYCLCANGHDSYIHCSGAKIWLVPKDNYDETLQRLIVWDPWNSGSPYLFETDLITYTKTECNPGAAQECGTGSCLGTQTCGVDGNWGTCSTQGNNCGSCVVSGCYLTQGVGVDSLWETLDYWISGTRTCDAGICSASTCNYNTVCSDSILNDSAPEIEGISVSGCAAVCDQDSDCPEYSDLGGTCYYNGGCNFGSCVCDYDSSKVCPADGWFCNEGVSEYRVYDCASTGCEYEVTQSNVCDNNLFCDGKETCNGETGLCQDGELPVVGDEIACTMDSCDEIGDIIVHAPNDVVCQDGLYCNGEEYCNIELGCLYEKSIDCSINTLNPFSVCNNNPDNNPFTFDVFTGFNSICNEETDSCSTYHEWDDLTHTCSVSECHAECDDSHACLNKCEGSILSYSGECTNACGCDYETEDCWQRTCLTGLYCVAEQDLIYYRGDEYDCVAGAGGSDCGIVDSTPCTEPNYCNTGSQCNTIGCGDTDYICYNGIWEESLTEICNNGIDDDCDEDADCADPDCSDLTAPNTTKTYGLPIFPAEGYPKYINYLTPITLNAIDPQGIEECISGLSQTYYRVTLLQDNNYCLNQETCQTISGTGEFLTYTAPFGNLEDSCHLIEYYSIDNKGNQEATKKQCVFVDNQAPAPIKIVGEVKTKWTPNANQEDFEISYFYPEETANCWIGGENEIECWKVTLDTPIDMTCDENSQPHPVGFKELCFNVGWDGDDVTQSYCGEVGVLNSEGYCCTDKDIIGFNFKEESEHNLNYYCEDKLGNRQYDEEKFKVFGVMEDISLDKKWNLISVPFDPINKNPEAVFSEVKENISSVWSYNAELNKWFVYRPGEESETNSLEEIESGLGYWIMAEDDDLTFNIGGSLLTPGPSSMPSQKVVKGWNLIGYYGTEPEYKSVYCALFSLVDTQQGFPRGSSLWGYDSGTQGFSPLSLFTGEMYTEKGYWLEMDVEDYYVPSTLCISEAN
jgi:hypothetical protein